MSAAKSHLSIDRSLRSSGVTTLRLYCLASCLLVIGLKWMVTLQGAYDPLWLRFAVGSYFAAVIGVSFVSEKVRAYLNEYFGVGIIIVAVWMALMLWGNDFFADYSSGYTILSVASVLLFDTRRMMALFTIVAGATLVLAAAACVQPPETLWAFVTLSLTIFAIGNMVVAGKVKRSARMDEDLSRSLTIQEAAIESNTDAILLVDQEGNYIKANSAFLKMWGVTPAHIAGNQQAETEALALSLAVDPEGLRRIWAHQEGGLGIGELRQVEFTDGRMIELYWRPMINHDELIGRLWFFRDVTRRWNREKALIATEKQLRHQNEMLMEFASSFSVDAANLDAAFKEITSVSTELLNVDTVGVWFFDRNKESMQMQLQYDLGTKTFISGAKVMLVDHPEYFAALFKSRVFSVSNTLMHESTAGFIEGRYSGKAVALMHAQIRARGECIGVLSFECAEAERVWTSEEQHYAGSLADLVSISMASQEKQQAQDRLSNSMAILQAIFDLSETGIIVEDSDHNILNYNELYLKVWKMPPGYVEANSYKTIVEHCLSQLKNSTAYEEGLEKLKVRPGMEYAGIMEFHDGRFVERYSKAIEVGAEVKGRVWFYLDITDRKRKENELINRNFELDSFVYRASHDLKAPLNSIMGLISLIREEQDLDPILTYITMMDRSVKKLDDFIKQLTQFSQDARINIVCKSIEFQPLLEEIIADLKYMDHASRLHIDLQIEQQGQFFSDPVRLGIVLSNMLSNAIKYQDLKKEKSTLRIAIHVDETRAECIFEDNGLGISAEHLEKVFDLFFRASVQASGTGLGLYITHNAIQKLGGTIQVTSALGVGTTFTLSLPSFAEMDDFKPLPEGDTSAATV